jgi:NRAMP (natural resistance-associated macrophage protein)-like metal ion transporter
MTKNLIEKTIEAPAEALELGIEGSKKLAKVLPQGQEPLKRARNFWYMLGPGLTTGASDDDPSGIATYSQAGAQYGFGFLWLSLFTFPLMAVVQEMCARIGLVTGRGLAGTVRTHFGKRVLYVSTLFLFAANSFNIGADIGAMANAAQLVVPHINFALIVVGLTVFILGLQIFTPYVTYARYLKWLALVLFAYILSALLARPDWVSAFHSLLVPHVSLTKDSLLLICAVLGTTITPYLFFWQTSQEIEEEIAAGQTTLKQRQGSNPVQIKKMRIDVWVGMLFSNGVMFFIIAACASTLFRHGITNIATAAQAAAALKPFAGENASLLFALGIFGMGLLAIPVLAGSSAYAISESLGKRQGLNNKLKQGYAFYGVIIISMLIGLGLNFIGLNPIKALIYSAVLNGIVAPIILVQIVLIASNRHIMKEWVNGPVSKTIGWVATLLMAISGIAAIWSLL